MHPAAYSLFSAIAYATGLCLYYFEARRKKIPLEPLLYIFFGALVGGLIGSKLGSVFFVYWDYFSKHLSHIFIPQIGGKTVVGGLIGGYLGVIATKKIIKFTRSTGDLFAPALAMGIAIGRIGCYFNGCCYGINGFPTQLIESAFSFGLFVYLWSIRKKVKIEGDLFRIFLIAYAFFRFWIEFFRADAVGGIYGFSSAQIISIIVFVWAGISLINKGARYGKENL
ncbi:MAG: prolipoprotein diacylglyceryl transferase [Candidatus Omnitrophota bacterium]|jgi:phosphatidylglycerol:prolipoprotein diacylglycerol transferase